MHRQPQPLHEVLLSLEVLRAALALQSILLPCCLQYTSQAAQRYKQQLEKDAAKLSVLPMPEALAEAPNPVPAPDAPTSAAAPPSTSGTAASLAAASAPAAAAASNGQAAPEANGALEAAPAGLHR